MDFIDLILIILALAMLFRGLEIGSVRQVLSTAGFLGGLFLGAWLSPHFVRYGHTPLSRSMITLLVTLGVALIGLSVAEYVGEILKNKLRAHKIDALDRWLGAVLGIATLLATAWLGAAILIKLPYPGLQNNLRGSAIISELNQTLPPAPNIVADLGREIDPNGFPEVFSGGEPAPSTAHLPSLGSLQAAVTKDQASVVKIEGSGCGGIVEGSGFVAAHDIIATNAHVVAGVDQPFVLAQNGDRYRAMVIWFDPNLDFAVLRVSGLNAAPLPIDTQSAASGTAAAVLGYPGGGNFTAGPAAIMQNFTAIGRNIYNQGGTTRNVYEIKATVIPGNSGGPLVETNGSVIGIIFAESTDYNQVGYALTTVTPQHELNQAEYRNAPVSSGQCAE